MRTLFSAIVLLTVGSAHAFNALGHKVVADVAWRELTPEIRRQIVDTLRRHPRFDEDFAKEMPAEADDDERWIFQQAAIWPDIARGFKGDDLEKYNRPTWHYINVPFFPEGERPLFNINQSRDFPTPLAQEKWNVAQALAYCRQTLAEDREPVNRALAYCWLFHLTGDIHQPMHSTALFCERFPSGDKGGNSIPVIQGGNLHALWDGLLGSSDKPNEVKREVERLHDNTQAWKVERTTDVNVWIDESHRLAESFAYSPLILQAVNEAPKGQELAKINLPEEYLKQAGFKARSQVVAAGLRLAAVLSEMPNPQAGKRLLRGMIAAEQPEAAAGVKISGFYRRRRPEVKPLATSDDLGKFGVRCEPEAMALYAQSADGKQAGILQVGVDDKLAVIELRPTTTATGRIVDKATGKGLSGQQVIVGVPVRLGDDEPPHFYSAFGSGVRTDDDGKFVVDGIVLDASYEVKALVRREEGKRILITVALIGKLQAETPAKVDLGELEFEKPK